MKYCPNCGAAFSDGTASFCSECGKQLAVNDAVGEHVADTDKAINATGNKKKKAKKDKPVKQKKSKKEKKTPKEIIDEPVDDGYDGYYNDVLPPDLDRVKEGLDKELVKKVVAVAVGVVFIISMCVVMLYVL